MTYGLTDGQKFAGELGYIPLPAAVVEKSKAAWRAVQYGCKLFRYANRHSGARARRH